MFFTRRAWLADTAERAVSAAAETALAMLSADGLGILDVDWHSLGSVSGLAFVAAVLKALAKGRRAEARASRTGRHVDTTRPAV